jgi:transportin-3
VRLTWNLVAEDYLFIITPLVEYNPDILFLSPAFSASFTLLASSLQLFHTDTIFRSLGLIRSILGHDALNPATQPPLANATLYAASVRDAIQKEGLALVGYLFAGLLDHFQPEMMSGVITTVRILTMYWPAEMQQWVPLVLGQVQVPPAVEDAKVRFLNEYGQ